jgi:hypothetical protein
LRLNARANDASSVALAAPGERHARGDLTSGVVHQVEWRGTLAGRAHRDRRRSAERSLLVACDSGG